MLQLFSLRSCLLLKVNCGQKNLQRNSKPQRYHLTKWTPPGLHGTSRIEGKSGTTRIAQRCNAATLHVLIPTCVHSIQYVSALEEVVVIWLFRPLSCAEPCLKTILSGFQTH